MTLPLPDPQVEPFPGEDPSPQKLRQLFARLQRNFDAIRKTFPLSGDKIAEGAITPDHTTFMDYGTWYGMHTFGTEVSTAATANRMYFARVIVHAPATLTGITYLVGGTSNGNVRSALYDSTGQRVANRTTNAAQGGANTYQQVAFDSTYAAQPGVYFLALIFSSGTGTFFGSIPQSPGNTVDPGSFATPSSITAPTNPGTAAIPTMSTY